jgi:hypothetical protein
VLVLACAPAALAAGASQSTVFTLYGATEPTSAQSPQAYVAARARDTARWAGRLSPAQRSRLAAVDFDRRIVVAAFLDGHPCASDVRLSHVARQGSRLIVTVAYTQPPIGVATCVRRSIRYVVLGLDRSGLAQVPTHATVRAVARA